MPVSRCDLLPDCHVFARSRNTPYRLHYRYHDRAQNGDWSPWEEVRVDVPTYDKEKSGGIGVHENGTYLVPVVWQGRVLLFFPIFSKKTSPKPASAKKFKEIAETETPKAHHPYEFWEVKLGWSERRNGKWTQKQISPLPIVDGAPTTEAPDIASFGFVPRLKDASIDIDVFRDGSPVYGSAAAVGRK